MNSFALQEDGKILVASSTNLLNRLNPDGTPDSTFGVSPEAFGDARALAVQDDGTILIAGSFIRKTGTSWKTMDHVNGDGTWASDFTSSAGPSMEFLALQADSKILGRGILLQRFNPDGSADNTFHCPLRPVYYVAPLQDGRMLVSSSTSWRGVVILLNPDGSPDPGFSVEAEGIISCLAVQADGKIIVGGCFSALAGHPCYNLGRLNPDGTFDTTFNSGMDAKGRVDGLVLQADGRILVKGRFEVLGGLACTNFGRLNPDGTLDTTFPSLPYFYVDCLALQADGRILCRAMVPKAGGTGLLDSYLVRLTNTGPATQTLTFENSTLTWLRGGTGPEVWRTSFQASTNGADWLNLGPGERIPGGWQLRNVSLPLAATFRARGYVIGAENTFVADYSGSSWHVETMIGPPAISRQPSSRVNDAGSTAVFSAWGGGTGPLSWQWRKNGIDLEDTDTISGARTPILTLSNVLNADAAGYSLVLSNAFGSVTSAVARLSVLEPIIWKQPVSLEVNGGQAATLSVDCAGTPPLSYQWRKDRAELMGATNSSLVLGNSSLLDIGSYDVVVANRFGAVTSTVAKLLVNLATLDAWNPGLTPGDAWPVLAFAEQTDGNVLVGGSFTALGGEPRPNLGRLTETGAVDTNFIIGPVGGNYPHVHALAVQPDGRILVGGLMVESSLGVGPSLGRLNPNGSLDPSFNPGPGGIDTPAYMLFIGSLLWFPDGKIVVGGRFDTLARQPCKQIGRLNPDGSLDSSFRSQWSGPYVTCLAAQPDGKILVGCSEGVVRLNVDGSLDSAFLQNPTNSEVYALAVQPDGKILVGGDFSILAGQPCANLGRLNPDGILDTTFAPFPFPMVSSIVLQANGKIVVAPYSPYGEPSVLRRLNPDGKEDTGFIAFADNLISTLALQEDGRLLVGGLFTRLAGQPRNLLGRLANPEPATRSLSTDGSSITWLRGGSSPEVWRTTFECSTNGIDWVYLGAGERIPGGWRVTSLALPGNCVLRARGYVTGGEYDCASWFVESQTTFGVLRPAIQIEGGSVAMNADGLRFKVRGHAGHEVMIECSTDLLHWTALATNIVHADVLEFRHNGAIQAPMRFYRASVLR